MAAAICSVPIGDALMTSDDGNALRAAEVSTLASKDFNQGLRAYHFSLAALGWFVNAWVFMPATTLLMGVLYWREYHSQAMRSLRFVADIKK